MATNKRLNASIVIGGTVTGALKAALGTTADGVKKINTEVKELTKRQFLLGKSISTLRASARDTSALESEFKKVGERIDRVRIAQERLNKAQAQYKKLSGMGSKAAGMGVAAGVGAAVVGGVLARPIHAASEYAQEISRMRGLGLGDAVAKDAEKYAKGMRVYGVSTMENVQLMSDALSVFGDLHHAEMAMPMLAKMKFGNAAVFGSEHGTENENAFMNMLKVIELRGGTKSKADFESQANMVQKVISATRGRVQADEWRNVISTGGTAAKLMRDDAFYYQLEPLVQMMGGDKVGTGLSAAYTSLYQGRTTKRAAINLEKYGLIGDKTKVKHDKVGQTSQLDPGALLGAKLFRESQYEWVKQVLLPTLAKKGVTDQKEIVDVIGSFVSNKKGADMLAAMVMQQQLIDKDEKKNRGASNVDQVNKEGQKTPAGKLLAMQKRRDDLQLKIGNAALPMYIRALELATGVLERMNGFMERNPRLSKGIVVGLAGIGASLAVISPILLAVGGALTSYAGYALLVGKLSAVTGRSIGVFSMLKATFRMLGGAIRVVGGAIMFMGRAMMANPILAVVGLIAGAAFLIWENWDTLGPKFKSLWAGITASFKAAFDWIATKIGWIGEAWAKTKSFLGFGDSSAPTQPGPLKTPTPASVPALPLAVPPMASARNSQAIDQRQYHVEFHQQPGQSGKDAANELMTRLGAPQRSGLGSGLYDSGL